MVIDGVPYFRQQAGYTCAVACLRMAYAFRSPGEPVPDEAEIVEDMRAEGLIVDKGEGAGTLAPNAFLAALNLGLVPERLNIACLETEIEEAVAAGGLVILGAPLSAFGYYANDRKAYHSALLVGIDSLSAYLLDPADPQWQGWQGRERLLQRLPSDRVIRKIERARFFGEWKSVINLRSERFAYAAFKV